MKHILLFLCALLFALTGNTAPACNEPEQLLTEARTATCFSLLRVGGTMA